MKTIVNTLLAFCCALALNAQTYAPDEIIIKYDETATNADRQAVRALYGIIDIVPLGEGIELWTGLNFPLPIIENGTTTVVNDVEELLGYIIEIQTNGQSETTTANINDGNLNLEFYLNDVGTLYEDSTFDPLPFCNDIYNDRLIGPDQSSSSDQQRIKIIILDQIVPNIRQEHLYNTPSDLGGSHGQKVYSVIKNILDQVGLREVEYINLPVFDNSGVSTSAALIEATIFMQKELGDGVWSSDDIILINFSANMIMPFDVSNANRMPILYEEWALLYDGITELTENVILISAAGNDQAYIDGNNIFPACASFRSEITVAGTQNCFSEPWVNTNSDPVNFEVAAEASEVLTFDGTNYQLSSGTSFAAAEVTAALAQIAAYHINIRVSSGSDDIIDTFLSHLPVNQLLTGTVQNGRVLDISAILGDESDPDDSDDDERGGGRPFFPGWGLVSQNPTSPLTLQTNPNPFSQYAIVNIGVEVGQSPQVSLYNSIGQLVHQEVIPNHQELDELQWYTPDQLARGTYLLRVQVGDHVEQQMIVKQ